MKGAHFVQLCS